MSLISAIGNRLLIKGKKWVPSQQNIKTGISLELIEMSTKVISSLIFLQNSFVIIIKRDKIPKFSTFESVDSVETITALQMIW